MRLITRVQAVIADATADSEDGKLLPQVQTAGTMTTQLEVNSNTIGFFAAMAAVQSTHVADLAATTSSGTPANC